LLAIPGLAGFLGAPVGFWNGRGLPPHEALIGWGRRPVAERLKEQAHAKRLSLVRLEDGLLRSFGMGDQCAPLSLIVDDVGIYYDSTQPSALESLLASDVDLLSGLGDDVVRAMRLVLEHRLSKYNHAPDGSADGQIKAPGVLVVDQTFGDMSVALSGASAYAFEDMLAAARRENPGATVYVKTHPEVTSGRKKGHLSSVQDGYEAGQRTVVLREAVSPMSLIEQVDRVYVVSSTMGFEALLAGKPVTCFGMPWYSGWGLTDDRSTASTAQARRNRQRSVVELFAAAYFHYARYLSPLTHGRGTIFEVIGWLALQRTMAQRMHGVNLSGCVLGVGFLRWRAFNLKPMLGLNSQQVIFTSTAQAAEALNPEPCDTLVCWGATPPAGLADLAQDRRMRLLHVEDGFVRSVGLGSDLIRPLSLVLDERGIYFDATRSSDLEVMLNTHSFTAEDLARAQTVRTFIVQHGITKYNLEPRGAVTWRAQGRLVVLVPGQVEDDASIRLGCTSVNTNLGLLKAVRAARPDAFIVYKPHPDVLSRNRPGRVALEAVRQLADHIEAGVSVVSCIEAADEVHTMTSLTGFDALLRSKKVVTYGQPFYAGWGLTEDRADNHTAFARRQRCLTLDQLVTGALLHYPIYWDWDLNGYTTCEAVLRRILVQRAALEANGNLNKLRLGWLPRQGRKLSVLWDAWTPRFK
jgi:capsular polysaccharide export protein